MSSSDRRLFILSALGLGAAALSGCGFAPAYGPGGPGAVLQGRVALPARPTSRDQQLLLQRLRQRLGPAAADAPWRLDVSVTTRQEGLGVARTGLTARYHLAGTARFALRSLRDDRPVLEGSVDAFVGYSATGNTVATRAAKADAHRRLMTILADLIVDRLLVGLPDTAAPAAGGGTDRGT